MNNAGLEFQRGNQCFTSEFGVPIKLDYVEEIRKGERMLRGVRQCSGKMLVNRIGFFGCFNKEARKFDWEVDTPGYSAQCMTYGDEVFIADDTGLHQINPESGLKSWTQFERDSISLITLYTLISIDWADEKEVMNVRSKKDGKIIWSHESEYGSFGTILSESGILVVECSKGYYSFVEETGELLWSFGIEDWQGKYLRGVPLSSLVSLRVLIDGIMYFGFSEGYIAAIDVKTCEPHWIHQLQIADYLKERKDRVSPRAIYYRNGELLFTTDQGRGHLSYLTILDAKTGEQLYQANENFTPAGCFNGVVINQYYVDGYERYLSVFDIEKRKTVWTYKHPKATDLFISGIVPFDNGFVAKSGSSLYWFKCDA